MARHELFVPGPPYAERDVPALLAHRGQAVLRAERALAEATRELDRVIAQCRRLGYGRHVDAAGETLAARRKS